MRDASPVCGFSSCPVAPKGRVNLFLGCLQSSNKINLFSASLPPGAPLNSTEWEITTDPSDPHTATPVIEQPEESRDGLARRLGILRL